MNIFFITILGALFGIFLGLLVSKIDSKLTWKQVLQIKFRVLIIAPIINLISSRIYNKKKSLGKLYKIRNKLNNILISEIRR